MKCTRINIDWLTKVQLSFCVSLDEPWLTLLCN